MTIISAIPYIGGKHRIVGEISKHLHGTSADTLVDVFGGSGAVTINSGFQKRVYNDLDGDLVNFFRVLADDEERSQLLRLIKNLPPSREIFEDYYREYIANRFSFKATEDQALRAFKLFYRLQFAFGGKLRSGGFTLSTGNRTTIKEVLRYRRSIGRLAALGSYFRDTAIEHLDFAECIALYGRRPNVVLFCDPPYVGKGNYYSVSHVDHLFLNHQLNLCAAAVVCTYYDSPEIRDLYKKDQWEWHPIQNVKNSQGRGGQKANAIDWILVRKNNGRS